jgi:hypothetical protein
MKKLLLVSFILVFLLSSCNLIGSSKNNAEDAAVAALQATMDAQNAAATSAAMPVNTAEPPTEEPTIAPPTETATPEPTATPTEIPVVKVTTTTNANCRLGPDKVFGLVEALGAGTTALVIGQLNTNGQWWKVRTDAGKECWVLGSNVTVAGDTSIVAFLESPPTPTPVPPPSWAGRWTIWMSGGFENTTNQVVTLTVDMVQKGNQLTYSFNQWGSTFNCYLTVSEDGMSAVGTLNRAGGYSWNLRFFRVPENLNQFRGEWYIQGNTSLDGMNCGAKGGASIPDPCRP